MQYLTVNDLTVNDIINLTLDPEAQKFSVYNTTTGNTIFTGYIDYCPDEILEEQCVSIDTLYEPTDTLTVNIDMDLSREEELYDIVREMIDEE